MKYCVVVLLTIAFGLCVARPAEDRYTTKYDGIDIDQILKSDRLFNNYYKCLLEQGKCTPDGRELKRVLPDALKTHCSKCSEKQQAGTDKVIRFLIENKPEQWEVLQEKYDPEHVYLNQYRQEAQTRGINL